MKGVAKVPWGQRWPEVVPPAHPKRRRWWRPGWRVLSGKAQSCDPLRVPETSGLTSRRPWGSSPWQNVDAWAPARPAGQNAQRWCPGTSIVRKQRRATPSHAQDRDPGEGGETALKHGFSFRLRPEPFRSGAVGRPQSSVENVDPAFSHTPTPHSCVNSSDFKYIYVYIPRVFKMLQAELSVSAGQAWT